MRAHLKAMLFVSVLAVASGARAEAMPTPDPAQTGSREHVAVMLDGHKLRIPAQMFYTAIPRSMLAQEHKSVLLRLEYPGLTTSHKPGKNGRQEPISFEEAVIISASPSNVAVKLPIEGERLVETVNDLDPDIGFQSYVLPDLPPYSETHNVYRLPAEPGFLVLCSDRKTSFSTCRMFFDEAGLSWMVNVRRKFLTDDVRQFRERLSKLIASFKAD